MIFEKTEIPGATIVELQRYEDDRGFFARGWCQKEFEEHGLPGNVAQVNISYNRHKHTLRGFHYQIAPHQEDKLMRCTRGAVHDVLIDLRRRLSDIQAPPHDNAQRRELSDAARAEGMRQRLPDAGGQ